MTTRAEQERRAVHIAASRERWEDARLSLRAAGVPWESTLYAFPSTANVSASDLRRSADLIEAVIRGVDPQSWPWPTDTASGIAEHADHQASARRFGWRWWIADLEGRLGADLDAQHSRTITRKQVEEKREQLRAAGQDHGYGTLARELHVSESTIRRRLGKA